MEFHNFPVIMRITDDAVSTVYVMTTKMETRL
jgi:hypothetical protein